MSKNKIDWRSEDVWKPRLDALKEKALKDWSPIHTLDDDKPITPTLVHDWKVSVSVGEVDESSDAWVFSARWPKDSAPPPEELDWIKQAIAYLGAPEDTEELLFAKKTIARYWLWKAPRAKA